MGWKVIAAGLAVLFAPLALKAQPAGVLGDWQDPTGSVLRIDHCGVNVCLWIVSVSRSAPATTDIHNSEPGQRERPLCGLRIGSGFTLRDPAHASGGTLYDPKTGKTYHGAMTAEGGKLRLRGYVGVPLFGESQTWARPAAPVKACSMAKQGN